jgi:hypothetical protein
MQCFWQEIWSMGLGNVAPAPVSDAVTPGISWGPSLIAAVKTDAALNEKE